MYRTLALLLPALIPSWRFFDWIAPSPRIEYQLHPSTAEPSDDWQELNPRPASIPWHQTLWRLFFNPAWNEQLFLASLAERIIEQPTDHSIQAIATRIARTHCDRRSPNHAPHDLQFRLIFLHRDGDRIDKTVRFTSPRFACQDLTA